MQSLYAGLDIGTTSSRLLLFREDFTVEARFVTASPLELGLSGAFHNGSRLIELAHFLAGKAVGMGARGIGVAVYRASIASWLPGLEEIGVVTLWLDYSVRASAWRGAFERPLMRVISKLPLLRRYSSPLSPLPLLLVESSRRRGWRVWSADALIAEGITGRYVTEPVNAGLLGAFNPLTGKRSVLYRLLGYSGEAPSLVLHDEVIGEYEGVSIAGLVADQQAAFLGSGCLGGGCASLVLGTGFFAQAAANPWRAASSSLAIPVPCLAASTGYTGCIEAMGPGLGVTLRDAAALAGGYEELEEIARGGCPFRETGIMLPYLPGAPVKPWPPRALLKPTPGPPGSRGLICAMIGGLIAGLSAVIEDVIRVTGIKRFRAVGGASRASWLLEAAARLSGATIEALHGVEAGALGAALLAGLALGDLSIRDVKQFTPGDTGATYEGDGLGGVLQDWIAVLKGEPASFYDALPRLLEKIESSL